MKTSKDVLEQGVYLSHCCGHERTFDKEDIFQRCPKCNCLCEWELTETLIVRKKIKGQAA